MKQYPPKILHAYVQLTNTLGYLSFVSNDTPVELLEKWKEIQKKSKNVLVEWLEICYLMEYRENA